MWSTVTSEHIGNIMLFRIKFQSVKLKTSLYLMKLICITNEQRFFIYILEGCIHYLNKPIGGQTDETN